MEVTRVVGRGVCVDSALKKAGVTGGIPADTTPWVEVGAAIKTLVLVLDETIGLSGTSPLKLISES